MHEYRTALVTGASKGIGAAISRRLVAEGLTVYAVARGAEALGALQAELGARLKPVVADATDHAGLARLLAGVEVDVLVNNAGGLDTVRPLHQQTPDETAKFVTLNLTAPLQLMQIFLPGMIARRRGHVFNLTSVSARSTNAGTTIYSATKAALAHAGRIIRCELSGSGVRLTDLAPGRVETGFYLEAFGHDQTTLTKTMYADKRPLRPEDIAETLIFALRLPSHVDLAEALVMPTEQAAGGMVYNTPPEG